MSLSAVQAVGAGCISVRRQPALIEAATQTLSFVVRLGNGSEPGSLPVRMQEPKDAAAHWVSSSGLVISIPVDPRTSHSVMTYGGHSTAMARNQRRWPGSRNTRDWSISTWEYVVATGPLALPTHKLTCPYFGAPSPRAARVISAGAHGTATMCPIFAIPDPLPFSVVGCHFFLVLRMGRLTPRLASHLVYHILPLCRLLRDGE